jgi:hypothetical protein
LIVKPSSKRIILALVFSTAWLLAPIGLPKLVYHCVGTEVFPVYYASPFIYKSTSLATSMAFDYYLAGFIGNVICWTFVLLGLRYLAERWLPLKPAGIVKWMQRIVEVVLILFSIFVFWLEFTNSGQTISFFADFASTAREWGMSCSPEFTFSMK